MTHLAYLEAAVVGLIQGVSERGSLRRCRGVFRSPAQRQSLASPAESCHGT